MQWPFDQVFLARHGQTEWNVQQRCQGQLDSPLTPMGIAQARSNATTLSAHSADAVFTSPLGRAKATAHIIAEAIGVSVVPIDELIEVHHGRFAGMTKAEIEHHYPGELDQRAGNKYLWRYPDGENYADADHRAAQALTVIASRSRRPVIVSHEMIGRMLMRNILRITPDEALSRSHPHDVIYSIDPAQSTVETIRADGR